MCLSSVVGRRVRTSVSHACGQWPLALAVASRPMIAAARLPAVSLPANSQFFRPRAMGRIAFSRRVRIVVVSTVVDFSPAVGGQV
jgi:hypothetical protein